MMFLEVLGESLFFRLKAMRIKAYFYFKLYGPGLRLLYKLVRKTNALIQYSAPARQARLLEKFDSYNFDHAIAASAARLMKHKDVPDYKSSDRSICFLSSEIYDSGGHSALIVRLIDFFHDCDIHYLESNCFGRDTSSSSVHTSNIQKKAKYFRMPPTSNDFEAKALSLYEAIAATNASVILVFIHMEDVSAAIVLAMLAQKQKAKIIFVPHADHLACMGLSFADIFIGARAATLDRLARFGKRMIQLPLPVRQDTSGGRASQGSERIRSRYKFGSKDFISLTGTPAYKIFQDKGLVYFKVIKQILSEEPSLKHFFISSLSHKEEQAIATLFHNRPDLLDRILFVKPTSDFTLYVQSAHVYIDTMPMGSALTLVDLMSGGCPPVIRICAENPLLSFADYLYDGYEYLCHTDQEMVEKTLYLLRHPDERQAVVEKLKRFYHRYYDTARVRDLWRDAAMPMSAAASTSYKNNQMAGTSCPAKYF